MKWLWLDPEGIRKFWVVMHVYDILLCGILHFCCKHQRDRADISTPREGCGSAAPGGGGEPTVGVACLEAVSSTPRTPQLANQPCSMGFWYTHLEGPAGLMRKGSEIYKKSTAQHIRMASVMLSGTCHPSARSKSLSLPIVVPTEACEVCSKCSKFQKIQ